MGQCAGPALPPVEPFPGSQVLATDPMSMGGAELCPVMMSILLPALNKAREQANRVKSASNLRQIGLAGLLYANAQNGKYPPDLATLLETQDIAAEVFVNPRSKTELPSNFSTMGKQLQKKWINEDSDYMWFGAGKTNSTDADILIACEKPAGLSDGLNMLFADGHVEFVASRWLMRCRRFRLPNPGRRTARGGADRADICVGRLIMKLDWCHAQRRRGEGVSESIAPTPSPPTAHMIQ